MFPRNLQVEKFWCFRCLLLVIYTHPFAKEALTLHLARGEGHKRYFDCNLMHCKVLASSHQHLMAEAPQHVPDSGGRTRALLANRARVCKNARPAWREANGT